MDSLHYFKFEQYLRNVLKVPESRVPSISNAIAELHSALCHLDETHLEDILNFEIENLIKEFAKQEELRNVLDT